MGCIRKFDVAGLCVRCDRDFGDLIRGYSRLRIDVDGLLEREEERNSEHGDLHGGD